ncbi:hypothetical protein [Serpentinicella alkaliphila]|uniref:Uncharacterized protein n=1 Tax=Serpentinicella alkaliphila TaxID=1734049 RepID=A0A4R2TYZ3_9FIRM|nr:hypothetical protein [Serpentinicella alkaliphila]QUH26605.1 hypothetical protein HZR23_13315 [Serpentinicella alkaliphila]TCQ02929.1 hypothetical protein EDD79_101259 [Serpentinicella alkaliphila]
MKKKSIILLIGVISLYTLLMSLVLRNSKDKDLRVEEYFPSEKMTKKFSGGYEREGFSHIVERLENGKVLIKQWDTGTGVAQVYQVSNRDIRLIYSETGESLLKDYINEVEPNRDHITLKAPLTVGTRWTSNTAGINEITGVNVKVFTLVGVFYAVEVTHKDNKYESKSYFAKKIGLIKRTRKGYESDNLIKLKYN